MEYGLLIAVEVIEALDRLPKRTRRKLLDQFYKIRSFPGNYSDYQEHDAVGRRVEQVQWRIGKNRAREHARPPA
jgi:mRNA-degrading endonuclease RelE of RelBE toxin-antitoxin system